MKKFLQIITLLIIVSISYTYYSYSNFKTDILITKNQTIEIKSDETIKDLANKLDINYYFLKQYLKNKDFKLLKWRFLIKQNSNIENILETLKKHPPEKQVDITILEWWNIYDIDDFLTQKWYINSKEYINYVENPEKIKALTKFYDFLSPDFISLEWYLYPDTYKIKYPIKINEIVIKQLDNFENKVYNKLNTQDYHKERNKNQDRINKHLYELITLASIVEKEEKNPLEKSTVAGILKYRLQNNWNIWADITVCYPHKLTAQECKMVVSKYIREQSEYNTRTMTWLPKTPIGNPSFETIYATLNDKKTEYRYYLHNVKTWEIHYAKTNAEHEANKKYMY